MKIKLSYALLLVAIVFEITISGQQAKKLKSDPNVPIFEIKNDLGQTVFAVYPGGVHIFIDDTQLKATGGGFKVGRIGTEKAAIGDILTIAPGEVNVYLDNPVKATGGGFKVGRVGTEKAGGIPDNYMTVTPDSTRIYTAESSNKGFAVGKLNIETGVENFLNLTKENYFIGHNSGINNSSGLYNLFLGFESGFENNAGTSNTFLGFKAGHSNTTGYNNVFIGNQAGYSNLDGYKNIFIGDSAGYHNIGPNTQTWQGNSNVFIGDNAGKFNTTGYHNVFLGTYAGLQNTTGSNEVFIGYEAGRDNTSGYRNVFVGLSSGRSNTTGSSNTYVGMLTGVYSTTASSNVFMGDGAGFKNTTGSSNVFLGMNCAVNNTTGYSNLYLGYGAGYNNSDGFGNVFIGSNAGANETTSNKLYIDNSSTATPLIYGDFSSNALRFNAGVGINAAASTSYALQINLDGIDDSYAIVAYGPTWCSSGAWAGSDIRFKKNILSIDSALEKIMNLRGVSYEWKNNEFSKNGFAAGRTIGVIAQEVENIIPELVTEGPDGYKAVAYDKLTAVIIEAMKEQQKLIEHQQEEIEQLKEDNAKFSKQESEIEKLKSEIEELKAVSNSLVKEMLMLKSAEK